MWGKVTQFVSNKIVPKFQASHQQGARLHDAFRQFNTTGEIDVAQNPNANPKQAPEQKGLAETGIADQLILRKILDEMGLADVGATPQVYSKLYAWEKNRNGTPQLQRMVLIDNTSLDNAIEVLKGLETEFYAGRDLTVAAVIFKILADQMGTSGLPGHLTDDRQKAEWLFKRLGFQSDVFKKLMEPKKYGKPTAEDYLDLFLKQRLLVAIKQGRKTTPEDYVQKMSAAGPVWQFKSGSLRDKDVAVRGFPQFLPKQPRPKPR